MLQDSQSESWVPINWRNFPRKTRKQDNILNCGAQVNLVDSALCLSCSGRYEADGENDE